MSIGNPKSAMASANNPSVDVEDLVQALKTDGFVDCKDATKSSHAAEFGKNRFPLMTSEGLDFCKEHVFEDSVRRCYSHLPSFSSNILSSRLPGFLNIFFHGLA